MSIKFLFIALMIIIAIPAAVKLYNHFKWNVPMDEVFAVLIYVGYFAITVFCCLLILLPWRTTYYYKPDGKLEKMRWCYYEGKEKIQEARSYPFIVRNNSDKVLELVWVGYGEVTTRRDTLAPGETIRYGSRVQRVQHISRKLYKQECSDSSPAYVVLALESGTLPADSLDRLQRQERPWEHSIEYEFINYN